MTIESNSNDKTSILFLCTGNSARSILAETIANEMFGDEIAAQSAGSKPKDGPHPLALSTLASHGLPTHKCRSKSWDEVRDEHFDLVITLCDSAAAESCPTFSGAPLQAHWGLPDPPASPSPESIFDEVFDALALAIETFLEGEYDIAARAEIAGRVVVERFPSVN